MRLYRVCKIQNDKCVSHKSFENESEAESYAKTESLKSNDFLFELRSIEAEGDDDDADDSVLMKFFNQGGQSGSME